ncbi:MAG: BPL-N domain-containing protein [Thermodesulfobacteriota bacterium]
MSLKPDRNLSPSSPSIGIYTGSGASHSWLWFVEILDRTGFYNVHFVDERDILSKALDSVNVLLMSGGDTFAIAEGLGAEGSNKLRSFIEEGGLYIGSCAGAYLPLRSSMNFLNEFNYINVKISNISRRLSAPERSSFERYACSSYGCDFVFHVVREDVVLEMVNGYQADGKKKMIAPLYGGPSMLPSEDIEPIAVYQGFTKKTKFLVEKELAEKTLIGKIAVAKKSIGKGHLYVFGPHFEHPHYPSCNLFLTEIIRKEENGRSLTSQKDFPGDSQKRIKGETSKELIKDLKRELSNSRIMASGMDDNFSTHWLIGNKYYEPGKISVFINTVWKRLKDLESMRDPEVDGTRLLRCVEVSKEITKGIKTIRCKINEQGDATPLAADLFLNLKALSSHFFELYFGVKRDRSHYPWENQ